MRANIIVLSWERTCLYMQTVYIYSLHPIYSYYKQEQSQIYMHLNMVKIHFLALITPRQNQFILTTFFCVLFYFNSLDYLELNACSRVTQLELLYIWLCRSMNTIDSGCISHWNTFQNTGSGHVWSVMKINIPMIILIFIYNMAINHHHRRIRWIPSHWERASNRRQTRKYHFRVPVTPFHSIICLQ